MQDGSCLRDVLYPYGYQVNQYAHNHAEYEQMQDFMGGGSVHDISWWGGAQA